MSDNLGITPGSGATLGTDETTISGTAVHVQRVSTGAAPTLGVGNVACSSGSPSVILTANVERKGLVIKALDGTVYLGGSGVTSGTGFKLDTGETFSSVAFIGAVYGITASGTVNVRYWEES
jgi:hypothetical protein